MGMREECKHFQSRTYKSGEVVRFCVLGNAPDQPWACPENCLTYERRFVDVGWSHGTLVDRPVEKPPSDNIPSKNDESCSTQPKRSSTPSRRRCSKSVLASSKKTKTKEEVSAPLGHC